LEPGKYRDESLRQGSRFAAPVGNFEIVQAAESAHTGRSRRMEQFCAEFNIDVTSLDSIRQTADLWLEANLVNSTTVLTEIAETSWGSRIFTATPVPGFSITFWERCDQLKGKPLALEGDLSAKAMRFAIVAARWNAVITDRLLQGSLDALFRSGANETDVEILRVPGAWEIPSAARKLAETGSFYAVITLGVLLRGETVHYEAIYNEVARGIAQSQQETGILRLRSPHLRNS
jgi:6,7-dimethyl-8-ribityllumazine synthase